jgi:hypothetical protein
VRERARDGRIGDIRVRLHRLRSKALLTLKRLR